MSDGVDIRLKTSFRDHRKRKKLAARLGPAGVVALIDLWLVAADGHPDGLLAGYSVEDVELDAGWAGAPGAFAAAIEECGWLDRVAGGFQLHDWAVHQPWLITAPERSARNRANVLSRWQRERAKDGTAGTPAACEPHTTRIRPVYDSDTTAIPLSLPSPSYPPNTPHPPQAGEIVLPFPSEAFKTAWDSWARHRAEKRQRLTPTTVKKQLAKLADLSEAAAIACIERSITCGWTGLFPERTAQPIGHQASAPQAQPTLDEHGREVVNAW